MSAATWILRTRARADADGASARCRAPAPSGRPGKAGAKVCGAEVRGVGAQITRRGNGTWFVKWRDTACGADRHLNLGAVAEVAAHRAREIARAQCR